MPPVPAQALALLVAAGLSGSPAGPAPSFDRGRLAAAPVASRPAYEKLQELTDSNAPSLLLQVSPRSVVIVYSSAQPSQLQTNQLEMVLRQSRPYTGAVNFYRLDQARYPKTWQQITQGKPWTQGPVYLFVSTSPAMIGTVSDRNNQPIHNLSSARLRAEIFRFFNKLQLPVEHVNQENVDRAVIAPGLPTFIMAYRSTADFNRQAQFQRFVYLSQLYADRVKFVMIDLDEGDLSRFLGLPLPRRDEPYFVLYKPSSRQGSLVLDPALSIQGMQQAIRSSFGPGHEPARVIP